MLLTAGRVDDAEAQLRRSIEVMNETLPAGDARIAAAASNLASVLDVKGEYAEAERLHATALAIARKTHGKGDPFTGGIYDNLGLNNMAQQRYAEAMISHRRALRIFEAALPPDHPRIATALVNLAAARRAKDGDGDAELAALLARAVEIRAALLGRLHFDTLQARRMLLEVLRAQGRDDEAAVH